MVKRYDQHQARLQALSLLGKDLARRSGRACELCDTAGTSLGVREVEPVPKAPDIDHCLFICKACASQLDQRKGPDANYWRFLEASAWKELPAVQVLSVRLLRKMAGADWAGALLDSLYLSPEATAWLEDDL